MIIRFRWRLFIPILLLFVLTSAFLSVVAELHRVCVCSRDRLNLQCAEGEVLAVHRAVFTTENVTCLFDSPVSPALNRCLEDIRPSVNNRCAGHRSCIFNFTDDHWDRGCSAEEEQGDVIVEYDCLPVDSVQRYCNMEVRGPEGYLSSPGYPGFFPKLPNCTWTIRSAPGQTLLLSVVDIDLPHYRRNFGRRICDDVLHLVDGTDTKLLSVCGQRPPDTVESTGDRVTVYFQTRSFTPFRGFLLHYRVHGCPTLSSPKLGYMVYRNGSSALYMCCEGHVFNDTLDNYRPLHCVDGFHWNASVPPTCISIEEMRAESNWTGYVMDYGQDNATIAHARVSRIETDTLADIVVPSILMAGLIIGNAVVLVVIIKIRRHQKDLEEDVCRIQAVDQDNKPSSSQEAVFA